MAGRERGATTAAKGFGMKLSVTGPPSNCPITDELISRMIGLETVQLDSGLLQNQIEELLGLYSQCVMYYDTVKDPIKKYFLEKIQICVSSKKSLEVINRNHHLAKQSPASPVKQGMNHLASPDNNKTGRIPAASPSPQPSDISEEERDTMTEAEYTNLMSRTSKKERKYSLNTQKRIRSMQVNMDCKAEEMARNETNSVPTLVQNHLQAQKQNNKMIQDSLNEQEARIRERLELRRVTSFQKSYSRNDTSMSALMVNFTPGDRTPGNAPFLLDDVDDMGLSSLSELPHGRVFEFGKNLLNDNFTSKLDTSNLTEGRQPHHLGIKPNSLHVTPFMINKAKSPRAEPTEVFKFPSQRAGSDDGSVKQKNIDLKIAEPEFTQVNVLPPSDPKQD